MNLNARMSGLVFSEKVLDKIKRNYDIENYKFNKYNLLLKKLESTNKESSDIKKFIISFFSEILGYEKDSLITNIPETEKVYFEDALQYEKPHIVYKFNNKSDKKFYFYIIPSNKKIDEKDDTSGRLKISYYGKFERVLREKNVKYGFITNGEIIRFVYAESGLITSYIEWDLYDFKEYENLNLFYNLFSINRLRDKESLFELIKRSQEEQSEITEELSRQVLNSINILVEKINEVEDKIELDTFTIYDFFVKTVMRMIFLLYAEENGVFPHGDPIYDENYGIIYLSNKLFERERYDIENLKESFDAWPRILALFNLVYYGSKHPKLGIVAHGGDLFEPKVTEFLSKIPIDNYSLTQIFKNLLYLNSHRVTYRVFSVEQIGYLYEGLLNYNIKTKNGKYYLNISNDRKSSGSYYTPPQLVRYVVEKTFDNLVINKSSEEILKLKIVDPTMGSGAFLVHSVRYLAEHLAKAWQNENKYNHLNYEEKIKEAKRHIVEFCIYGVDINPMAVELAKVSLWLETLSSDKSFSFLDHHLKVGNSLLGVWNDDNIYEVPKEVFKLKNDLYSKEYKDIIKNIKKENDKTNHFSGSLFNAINLSSISYDIETISKKALQINDYEFLEQEYKKIALNSEIEKEKIKRDLWLSNWFANEIDNVYPINSEKIMDLYSKIDKNDLEDPFIIWSRKMSEELKFFHWELEFPEVFKEKGFDAVVGNPPWEVLKLKELEFFKDKDESIASIHKANKRKKEIEKLKETNFELYNRYIREKQVFEKTGNYIRTNKRFKLTSKGEINLYQLFAELFLNLTKENFGIVVPTGLFTDNNNVNYFNYLVDNKQIYEINDFENKNKIFKNVDGRIRFSLFISKKTHTINIRILLTRISELYEKEYINISIEDLKLFNPNTKTLPMLKNNNEYKIIKKIYERSEVIKNEYKGSSFIDNIFNIYHMSNDSYKFVRKNELIEKGYKKEWYMYVKDDEIYLPLLEGKSFFILNSRYSEILEDGNGVNVTIEKLNDPYFFPDTRYYVKKDIFEETLKNKKFNINKNYFFVFRNITNSTNERTFIISLLPKLPAGNSINIFDTKFLIEFLTMSSHIIDFSIRKKIQGVNLNHFIFYQFPIPKPNSFIKYSGINGDETLEISLRKIFINLLNYSYDMEGIVRDLGGEIQPREWDEKERIDNFAKLDAIMAIYYDMSKDELKYIFSDFEVERKNQKSQYGQYLSEILALKYYDLFKSQIKLLG